MFFLDFSTAGHLPWPVANTDAAFIELKDDGLDKPVVLEGSVAVQKLLDAEKVK